MLERYLTYSNGNLTLKAPNSFSVIDHTWVPGAVTAGTPITLPNSYSYTGDEMQVWCTNTPLDSGYDWNFVGASAPRTQISFTFDLKADDQIRIRIG